MVSPKPWKTYRKPGLGYIMVSIPFNKENSEVIESAIDMQEIIREIYVMNKMGQVLIPDYIENKIKNILKLKPL